MRVFSAFAAGFCAYAALTHATHGHMTLAIILTAFVAGNLCFACRS